MVSVMGDWMATVMDEWMVRVMGEWMARVMGAWMATVPKIHDIEPNMITLFLLTKVESILTLETVSRVCFSHNRICSQEQTASVVSRHQMRPHSSHVA